MKTLIVYYSYTQNNEKLAHLLQRKLDSDMLRIEELGNRTGMTIFLDLIFNRVPSIKTTYHKVKDYDQVIFISPVWAARIASPLKTFILSEKENIGSYAFISICSGPTGQVEKIAKQLTNVVGKKPEAVCELSLNEMFRASKKKGVKYTPNYRVEDHDLAYFDAEINNFLGKSAMPLAQGWQVKHEYGD